MAKLLFIHGINNEGKSQKIIQSEWGNALNKGLGKTGWGNIDLSKIECAYYGDLLKEGAIKGAKKTRTIGGGLGDISGSLIEQMSEELDIVFINKSLQNSAQFNFDEAEIKQRERAPISRGGMHRTISATEVGDNRRGAGPHKSFLISAAKTVEAVAPSLSNAVVKKFLNQAAAYLEDQNLQKKINDTVIEQLFSDASSKDEPRVVVTHSNGTILSYFLFKSILKDWNIKAWYTIGCPLGARFMRKYLISDKQYPSNVQAWYNCWDKEDFVAYNSALTAKTIGIDGVVNINTFDTDHNDKHSITSYLEHAMLARLIASDL